MSRIAEWKNKFNQIYCLGRYSTTWYIRFYPNPGFMFPWLNGKSIKWSVFYGLKIGVR